jgi:hypothetical protein
VTPIIATRPGMTETTAWRGDMTLLERLRKIRRSAWSALPCSTSPTDQTALDAALALRDRKLKQR